MKFRNCSSTFAILLIMLLPYFLRTGWADSIPEKIEVVKANPEKQLPAPRRRVSKYGSFAIVEAPIKGGKWILNQTVTGFEKVGSVAVEGVLYPFKLIQRKKSGGMTNEKEQKEKE